MLRLIYLYRNLTRNPLRLTLTFAAIALPIAIYVLSMAVVDGIERFLDNSAKQLRLAVTHRVSLVNPLPEGYRAKIESLDPARTRLVSVCGMRWIGGKVEHDPRPLSTLGVDPDTFPVTFPEYDLTPDELDAWKRDRQAIIVGSATAAQFRWKLGDRITIRSSLPPYDETEYHVICIGRNTKDALTNWCRRDYIEEKLKAAGIPEGWVGFFFVKCATQADLDHFRVEIDRLFKGSLDETKTQDEKAFMNEFITQQFDLPRNLTILAVVTVFVAVMAAANTMSMNLRDRISEIATLKSMGFGGGFVFAQIQAESLLLCTISGLIGALGPYVAFTHTPLKNYQVPLILHLDVQPSVCAKALVISLMIGLVAAAWPAWAAMRLKVVAAMRTLE